MYRLRKPFLKRSISVFLLLVFINSVFSTTISYALTNGDTQPEYTTFSEGNATDLVNLMTGDFSFELPLINVPGPEGGFSIPLTYKAGIGLEEEASWVGLGFSLNAGAITRDIIQYPDDARGEITHLEAKDPGFRGWEHTALAGKIGWNNQIGHYGSVDMETLMGMENVSLSYRSGDVEVVAWGMHVNGYKPTFNSAEFVADVRATAMKVASSYAGPAFTIYSAAESAIMMAASGGMKQNGLSSIGANWRYNRVSDNFLNTKRLKIWLDQTRQEEMYGILNLGKMPMVDVPTLPTINTKDGSFPGAIIRVKDDQGGDVIPKGFLSPEKDNVKGPGSDMISHDYLNYHTSFTGSSQAKDLFNVMGNGISGRIEPYRLEVGSLAIPADMSEQHTRLALFPCLDYKVQFKYAGAASNSYHHHVGISGTVPDLSTPIYGMTTSVEHSNPQNNNYLGFTVDDKALKTIRTEADRIDRLSGYKNKKIAFGRNIEWYTNREIYNEQADGFIDFLNSTDSKNFRGSKKRSINFTDANFADGISLPDASSYFYSGEVVTIYTGCKSADGFVTPVKFTTTISSVNSNTVYLTDASTCSTSYGQGTISKNEVKAPADGIGGFSITSENGLTHHYALPIYAYNEKSLTYNNANRNQYSSYTRDAPFANTWLLTSITGPDYLDRGIEGFDETDWGYWVKLDYGKSSDNYAWRVPFDGEKVSADGKNTSFSSGNKQLYYLDRITTRSHTAIFIKEAREDGRSYLSGNGNVMYRLNDVITLKNETFANLVDPIGGNLQLGSNNILDVTDLTKTALDIIDQNSIRKIHFNYSYTLCNGVPNSSSGGKLTLNSISTYGKGNAIIMPDYTFQYAYNPDYNKDYWDGWGYYSRSPYSKNNHTPGDNIEEGAAWSLTRITNPLGSSINITYERDTYSSVGGETVAKSYGFSDVSNPVNDQMSWWDCSKYQIGAAMDEIEVGDQVRVEGQLSYKCADNSTGSYCFNLSGTISNVDRTNKFVWLSLNDSPCHPIPSGASSYCNSTPPSSICSGAKTTHVQGVIHHTIPDRKGGDLRVAAIAINDGDGNNFETHYKYTTGNSDRISSGVVAMQTNYDYENINSGASSLDPLPDWSFTPVIYGKTTVLGGYKNGKYNSKVEYEFETPNRNMINVTKIPLNTNPIPDFYGHELFADHNHFNEYLDKYNIIVDNYTSKIGVLKSIHTYDGTNTLKGTTEFLYTSTLPDNQGVFTEGNMVNERVNFEKDKGEFYHRSIRTTKRYHPYVLKKIINSKDGLVATKENKEWDFITGIVLQTESKDPLGLTYRTEVIPAYHVAQYAGMGSKSEDINNSNMLAQVAAQYVFKGDNGIVGASVTTWNNSKLYRELNTGNYDDSNIEQHNVWRVDRNYIWKGTNTDLDGNQKIDAKREDGTFNFTDAQKFVFGGSNPEWQLTEEVSKYDHYSMPIEVKNLNGNANSYKMDLKSKRRILEASNALFTEVAAAGFESDVIISGSKSYLEGEIEISSSSQIDNSISHTGTKSYKIVNPSEKAISYKVFNNSTSKKEFDKNRHYRLSVWVNNLNGGEDQAELYYTINNGSNSSTYSGGKTSLRADNWFQFNLTIDKSQLLNAVSIEVGVRKKASSNTTPVYIDDFRFQPINSSMVSYVYNSLDELEYTLDNQNMYSKFEYDNAGRITATYIEVLSADGSKKARKVSSKTYNVAGTQ